MIGTWKVSAILQTELNEKLRKFVVNQENPPIEIRRQKPLRAAKIKVVEVENDPGWYQATLTICPHLTHMGSNFELSMIARLDREKDR